MEKAIHRCHKEKGQSSYRRTEKETGIRKQNEYGNATAANAANADLYGSLISTMDYCISDHLWTDYCPIAHPYTMDNVYG